MRLGLLVNGSAGECGVKDQVSYNRVGMKRGGWQGYLPRFVHVHIHAGSKPILSFLQ